MTTGIAADHLARLQGSLKASNDRIYELERRLRVKQTNLRKAAPVVPHCEIWLSANQSIAEAEDAPVAFNQTVDASIDLRSGASIVIQRAGPYLLWANVKWAASYSDFHYGGYRSLHIAVNGTVIVDDHKREPESVHIGNAMTNHGSRVKQLAVGDVVTALVLHQHTQTSLNLNLEGGTGVSAFLGVCFQT